MIRTIISNHYWAITSPPFFPTPASGNICARSFPFSICLECLFVKKVQGRPMGNIFSSSCMMTSKRGNKHISKGLLHTPTYARNICIHRQFHRMFVRGWNVVTISKIQPAFTSKRDVMVGAHSEDINHPLTLKKTSKPPSKDRQALLPPIVKVVFQMLQGKKVKNDGGWKAKTFL